MTRLVPALWCIAMLTVPLFVSARTTSDDNYDRMVDDAEDHWDAGAYQKAFFRYRNIMQRQRTKCRVSRAAEPAKGSPCWRMMMMRFNMALSLAKMHRAGQTIAAFRSYFRHWNRLAPGRQEYPFQDRGYFEMGRASQASGALRDAVEYYRRALAPWREGRRQRAPRFAQAATESISLCIAELSRQQLASKPDLRPTSQSADAMRVVSRPLPKPRRNWSAWSTAAVVNGGLALASEAAAIGLTVAANGQFKDTAGFRALRGGAIAGHVIAGSAVLAAALCIWRHYAGATRP